MKTTELFRWTAGAFAVAFLCGPCGCTPSVDTPTSSVRANAMEDYQAGRFDAAIAGFEHVLKSDAKDWMAHFQLAQLLQNERKDYLGAIVHFKLYLDMRPPDDKTTLAADRIEECKNMLLADHARKNGAVPTRAPSPAAADKKLTEDNARLTAELARLRSENKNLRYLLASLGEADKGRPSSLGAEAKKILAELRVAPDAEEARRRSIIPTDKELLEDDSDDGPLVSSSSVKDQISKMKRDEASDATRPPVIKKPPVIVDNSSEPDPKPVPGAARSGALDGLLGGGKKTSDAARPSTYVVQNGDTLMTIAARFYGSRSKWRDIQKANIATISADGRVKAGQTIKLP